MSRVLLLCAAAAALAVACEGKHHHESEQRVLRGKAGADPVVVQTVRGSSCRVCVAPRCVLHVPLTAMCFVRGASVALVSRPPPN